MNFLLLDTVTRDVFAPSYYGSAQKEQKNYIFMLFMLEEWDF
jgi:hypothetical protein